jgi:hypothetical protein
LVTKERSQDVRALLRSAQEAGDEVYVRRRFSAENDNGFVVAVEKERAMINSLGDDVRLDGFTVFRLDDVRSVRRARREESVAARVLDLDGEWPPTVPSVDLSDPWTLITSAAEEAGIVGFYVEGKTDATYIGVPLRRTKRNRFQFLKVTPSAKWDPDLDSWRLQDVTKVDFGLPYHKALLRLAGDPPARA